jgi:heptosyltransferase-2
MFSQMKKTEAIQNILIIKPGAIGDLIQMTPVLRALKRKYPDAAISILVGSSVTAELFRHDPSVFETIVYDRRGEHSSARSFFALWSRLHKKRYDLVLNFQRSNIKTWLLVTSAFPCRVLVYHKTRAKGVHAVVNHLKTLAPLGISPLDLSLELHPGPEAGRFAETFFTDHGLRGKRVIALNPGASHVVNRWGTSQFAALADRLAERLSAKIVVIGGKADVALAEEISAQTKSSPLVIAGKTSLLQLGAILKKCDVLVSADTGPLHLAVAVGTRVVALFGAADPERTGPIGPGHKVIQAHDVACLPCRSRTCKNSVYLECMKKITVDEVFDAVDAIIKATAKRVHDL